MGKDQHSKPKMPKPSNKFLKYGNLGFQLVLNIGLAGFAGYWIDSKLELKFPAFLLSFILLAFTGSMYKLYRELQ